MGGNAVGFSGSRNQRNSGRVELRVKIISVFHSLCPQSRSFPRTKEVDSPISHSFWLSLSEYLIMYSLFAFITFFSSFFTPSFISWYRFFFLSLRNNKNRNWSWLWFSSALLFFSHLALCLSCQRSILPKSSFSSPVDLSFSWDYQWAVIIK